MSEYSARGLDGARPPLSDPPPPTLSFRPPRVRVLLLHPVTYLPGPPATLRRRSVFDLRARLSLGQTPALSHRFPFHPRVLFPQTGGRELRMQNNF